MNRVEVRPALFGWARERARLPPGALKRRFPNLVQWERGADKPTLKQVEALAKATFTPVGYFFLPEPPEERLPLPDFRTVRNTPVGRPSPHLLDTVYACQERQAWYQNFARSAGQKKRPFVASVTTRARVEEVAEDMRKTLAFDLDARADCPAWTDALRRFIRDAEAAGVLVMCSGVVVNNRRPLDPDEFRGFAIADDIAPLVFINGAASTTAQMFTLAHELAHLWLGQSGVCDAAVGPDEDTEGWCNRVATEFLTSLHVPVDEPWAATPLTQAERTSVRFTRALISDTLGGHTLFRDAFRMLGISKMETFHRLGRQVGAP